MAGGQINQYGAQSPHIDNDNPILILDTPRSLSFFIKKYGLTKQGETEPGGLTRYAECILEIAKIVSNHSDPDDPSLVEMISKRIDEACEYIGAYSDPLGMTNTNWLQDGFAREGTMEGNSDYDPNYYPDAVITSKELINEFVQWVLKYNLRNVTNYIPHLNDYQLTLEIYRL